MMEIMQYQAKRHRRSNLVSILATPIMGVALVTCGDFSSSPSDGGLSDRAGNSQSQSDPAGGTTVFIISCSTLPDNIKCPSGEGWRVCTEARISRAELADYQNSCANGTFSMDPCPTNFREKCELAGGSASYYHDCELSDAMRSVIEGACATLHGDLITR